MLWYTWTQLPHGDMDTSPPDMGRTMIWALVYYQG